MPARAKGKTPARLTRKSQRLNDAPSTPGWTSATGDMFKSPAFSPPMSPPAPRSRQIKEGRITKQSKPVPKARRQTIIAAAKTSSPAVTRGRRATMLPSQMKMMSPGIQRRTSIYQRRGTKKIEEFKMPEPAVAKQQTEAKKFSLKTAAKKDIPKKSPAKNPSPKKSPAKKSSPKKSPAKKASPKKSPAKKASTKKSPAKMSPAKKVSPKTPVRKSAPEKKEVISERTTEPSSSSANKMSPEKNEKSPEPKKTKVNVSTIVTPKQRTPVSVKSSRTTGRSTRRTRKTATPATVTPKTKSPVKASPKSKTAKQNTASKSFMDTSIKVSPRTSSVLKKKGSPRVKLMQTPGPVEEKNKNEMEVTSFYSSPISNTLMTKIKTPVAKLTPGKGKVLKSKSSPAMVTPVNKFLEKVRGGTDSWKKVKIMSDQAEDEHKVYRKTPSRGKGSTVAMVETAMVETAVSTETPPKAARILGKTTKPAAKILAKPKKLAESLLSPKTSTPVSMRKRRADFPLPVSEIRQTKKKALESTTNNVSVEESMIENEMSADMSLAKPEDVRPTSWWGWCNIL